MLGKTLAFFHLAGAILSLALLVSTFLAKGIITTKAREIAVEKTRHLADPFASKLQDSLDGKVTGTLIRGKGRERLEAELGSYLASPDAWLIRLADGGAERARDFDFPEVEQPLARKVLDTLAGQVAKLKSHVQDSYHGLIVDLRIFAGTNLAAFLFAAWLCTRKTTHRVRFHLLAFSCILLVAAAFSILVYVDQNWTWTILTRSYFGWGYPALLGAVTIYLLIKVAPSLHHQEPTHEKRP
jgi:hypothetical protein